MPEIGVSSTMVRERVAAGRPVRWLVPDAVAELIAERGLYRSGRRGGRTERAMTPTSWRGGSPRSPTTSRPTDIVALDVAELVGYTDVMLICTARNERLAKAIHDEVHERLKHEDGLLPSRSEGVGENRWILLDYLDCILHVFVPETRERYRLEQLWGEADELDLGLAEPTRRRRRCRPAPRLVSVHRAELRRALFGYRRADVEEALAEARGRGRAQRRERARAQPARAEQLEVALEQTREACFERDRRMA